MLPGCKAGNIDALCLNQRIKLIIFSVLSSLVQIRHVALRPNPSSEDLLWSLGSRKPIPHVRSSEVRLVLDRRRPIWTQNMDVFWAINVICLCRDPCEFKCKFFAPREVPAATVQEDEVNSGPHWQRGRRGAYMTKQDWKR